MTRALRVSTMVAFAVPFAVACGQVIGIEDRVLVSAPAATAGASGTAGSAPAGGVGGGGAVGGTGATGGAATGGVAGASGTSGASGAGGSAGAAPCGPALACTSGTSCATTDALGCHLTCNCGDGEYSCSSDCCVDPVVGTKACTHPGAHCNDDCGATCSCEGGTWSCPKTCKSCPETTPDQKAQCVASEGTVCTYGVNGADTFVACACTSVDANTNAWACAPSAAGGMGGASGAGGAAGSGGTGTGGAAGLGGAGGGSCAGQCSPADPPCSFTDALGCAIHCVCGDSDWSCSSDCCTPPPVGTKSCAVDGLACINTCGKPCSCTGGSWSCGAACTECPESMPGEGTPCYLDAEAHCAYPGSSGTTSTCVCASVDASHNAWKCSG